MKKLLFGTMLLALVIVVPIPTMAQVDIRISFPLPPPIVFAAPPEVIVIPDTYVYVVPDIDVDIFFWVAGGGVFGKVVGIAHVIITGAGVIIDNVPSFYFEVDPGWRRYYRDRNWYGHRWNYERIPHQRLQQNWSSWQKNRYWEKRRTWGVQNYQPRPQQQRQELRQQRQQQYQQRPEVRQHQQQRQQQQKTTPGSETSGSSNQDNQNNSLRRKFSNRKDKSKDLGFSSRNNSLRREFNNHKDKSKDLRFSNRDTLSLKENLKNGRGNIESREKGVSRLVSRCRTRVKMSQPLGYDSSQREIRLLNPAESGVCSCPERARGGGVRLFCKYH
jgi:hypothetical protein